MIKINLQELMAEGHNIVLPLRLDISADETLELTHILRALPEKRVVAKAHVIKASVDLPEKTCAENIVLAKIFFHHKNYLHEVNSYRQLKQSCVKTPLLLSHQALGDGGVCYYEFLPEIKSLGDMWEGGNDQQKKLWTDNLLKLVALLSQSGLAQMDCHPGNFVFVGDELFLLDPAGCVKTTPDEFLYKHLAEIPSQFPPIDQGNMIEAIYGYFGTIDKVRFGQCVSKAWKKRKDNYLKKIFRDCSEIADLSDKKQKTLCRRDVLSEGFTALLKNPDAAMSNGKTIKAGRSTVVVKVKVDEKYYVVKRYQRSRAPAFRDIFGKNRARNNWRYAHLLGIAGIKTPRPCAIIELTRSLRAGYSYYVSDYVDADNAANYFAERPISEHHLGLIKKAFMALDYLKIKHGDCKITNWLVDQSSVWLVDLDAMKETSSKTNEDRERFLRDWRRFPEKLALFRSALYSF